MKNIVSKWKTWVIIALVAVLVGMVMLGVFGLNNSAAYKNSYEIKVTVAGSVNGVEKTATDGAEKYFADVNCKYSSKQTLEDGAIYRFDKIDGIKADALENAAKAPEGYETTVTIGETVAEKGNKTAIAYTVLAIAIAVVVTFVYALIAEKLASGIAVLVSAVLSALLYASLVAITRVPADTFFATGFAAAATLGAVLSVVMCNRFRETARMVTDEKLSTADVAAKGAALSFERFNFAFFALAVAAVSFASLGLILGATGMLFVGVHILIAAVVSYFAAFAFTPVIYTAIKKDKR